MVKVNLKYRFNENEGCGCCTRTEDGTKEVELTSGQIKKAMEILATEDYITPDEIGLREDDFEGWFIRIDSIEGDFQNMQTNQRIGKLVFTVKASSTATDSVFVSVDIPEDVFREIGQRLGDLTGRFVSKMTYFASEETQREIGMESWKTAVANGETEKSLAEWIAEQD